MKILYLTNSIPNPNNLMEGIFNYRRIRELKKKGIEVEVCYVNNILKRNFSIKYKSDYNLKNLGFDIDLKVKVFNNMKIPKIETINFLFYKIKKYYYKNNFDLIHIHFLNWGYVGYMLNKKYKIPYIITAHGSDIHTDPFNNNNYKNKALLALEKSSFNIFVSNYLVEKAKEFGYKNNNNAVIGNGVDETFFSLCEKKDNKTIGYVGNLVELKRVDLMLDIIERVKKEYFDIKFVIIGDGTEKEKIKEKIKILNLIDNVKLIGRIHPNMVREYMEKFKILLFISKKEGFGCVALEAQATGTLVLGSNNGGIPEAIGNKDFIVEDNEMFIENMAKKIIYYIENGYNSKKLINRARNFTWDKIVDKEIEIYKKILEARNVKN